MNLDRLKSHAEKRVCEKRPFKYFCGSRFERPLDDLNRSYQRQSEERCQGEPIKTSIAALEGEQRRRFKAEVCALKTVNERLHRGVVELERSTEQGVNSQQQNQHLLSETQTSCAAY